MNALITFIKDEIHLDNVVDRVRLEPTTLEL